MMAEKSVDDHCGKNLIFGVQCHGGCSVFLDFGRNSFPRDHQNQIVPHVGDIFSDIIADFVKWPGTRPVAFQVIELQRQNY